MSTFGERLRQWRKDKGVTSYALEKEVGIDRSNLRQIEKDLKPASEAVLDKLAKYPKMGIKKETLMAWQRLDGVTNGELLEIFKTLASDDKLLQLINQVLAEKNSQQSD